MTDEPSSTKPATPGFRLDWKWGAILVALIGALIIAGAIDGAGSRVARERYSVTGDGDAVWRLDGRTGELVRCEASGLGADNVACARVEDRALR
ncbi:MAG: hypothetical protein PVI23_07930 [Maricaulaceae bacterium]|jgi:hypothetical protein